MLCGGVSRSCHSVSCDQHSTGRGPEEGDDPLPQKCPERRRRMGTVSTNTPQIAIYSKVISIRLSEKKGHYWRGILTSGSSHC